MGHIFVSYAAVDKEKVQKLVKMLTGCGFVTWTDGHGITPGRTWRSQIVEAITTADVVILILSERSAMSQNVRKEIDIAEEARRPILPVEIESVIVPRELMYQLAGLQRIRMEGVDAEERLVHALKQLTHYSALESPAPTAAVHAKDPEVLTSETLDDVNRDTRKNAARSVVKRARYARTVSVVCVSLVLLLLAGLATWQTLERSRRVVVPLGTTSSAKKTDTATSPAVVRSPTLDLTTNGVAQQPSTTSVPSELAKPIKSTPLDRLEGAWHATDKMFDYTMTATLTFSEPALPLERRGKLIAVFKSTSPTKPAAKNDKLAFERLECDMKATIDRGGVITVRAEHSRVFQHDGTSKTENSLDHTMRLKWVGPDAFELLDSARGYVELSFKR